MTRLRYTYKDLLKDVCKGSTYVESRASVRMVPADTHLSIYNLCTTIKCNLMEYNGGYPKVIFVANFNSTNSVPKNRAIGAFLNNSLDPHDTLLVEYQDSYQIDPYNYRCLDFLYHSRDVIAGKEVKIVGIKHHLETVETKDMHFSVIKKIMEEYKGHEYMPGSVKQQLDASAQMVKNYQLLKERNMLLHPVAGLLNNISSDNKTYLVCNVYIIAAGILLSEMKKRNINYIVVMPQGKTMPSKRQ